MTEEASKQYEGNVHYIFKGIIYHEYAPWVQIVNNSIYKFWEDYGMKWEDDFKCKKCCN